MIKPDGAAVPAKEGVAQHAIQRSQSSAGADQSHGLIGINSFVKTCPGGAGDPQAAPR